MYEYVEWLIKQGLKPHHRLLDVGMGPLSHGYACAIIEFLDTGNYFGVDRQQEALYGFGNAKILARTFKGDPGGCAVAKTKARGLFDKRPTYWLSENFEFAPVGSAKIDVIICKDVWTHFVPSTIESCLTACRGVLADDGVMYATFRIHDRYVESRESTLHKFKEFVNYPVEMIVNIVRASGATCEYLGKVMPRIVPGVVSELSHTLKITFPSV